MMKLRSRLICLLVAGLTMFATMVLYQEVTNTPVNVSRRPGLGAPQVHIQHVYGLGSNIYGGKNGLKPNNAKDAGYSNSNAHDGEQALPLRRNRTEMFDKAIEWLLLEMETVDDSWFSRDLILRTKLSQLTSQLGAESRRRSSRLPWDTRPSRRSSNYWKFHFNARAAALYDPDDPAIDGLLHDMATQNFRTIEMMEKGTELKLLIEFDDGSKAVFKPMRWGREHETLPNHFYFNDYERHNAEIAAFHLDRLLGFYRVPPVTGRIVNMTSEIFMLAERKLRKTFYISPIGNLCFYGECSYYCDSRHSFCGKSDLIEGSLMAWLPEGPEGDRDRWKSPYRRSYSKFRKAEWEVDSSYCYKLLEDQPYLYERFMADFIDMHIFDFITGNMDRHHVEVFRHLRNDSCPLHMDNGRGFGKKNVDEFSILAPLRQCCVIRNSTLLKLIKLYIGPARLSDLLDDSLKRDPVYPVLHPGHLDAVDRRVVHILRTVAQCVKQSDTIYDVVIDDPF